MYLFSGDRAEVGRPESEAIVQVLTSISARASSLSAGILAAAAAID